MLRAASQRRRNVIIDQVGKVAWIEFDTINRIKLNRFFKSIT